MPVNYTGTGSLTMPCNKTHRFHSLDGLSGIIYGMPGYCCLCGALGVFDTGICERCRYVLRTQMIHTCKVCGIPLPSPLTLCRDCQANMYYFEACKSIGLYRGYLKSAIIRMKYYGERWLSRPLGLLLGEVAHSFHDAEMVVPVPLEPRSKQVRGYNQAKDLALKVARKIYLPLNDILLREVPRERQARLNRAGRRQNLRGTMKTQGSFGIRSATVLVVDDVTTTGATLDEAARALKSAGARKVVCVTLARTLGN